MTHGFGPTWWNCWVVPRGADLPVQHLEFAGSSGCILESIGEGIGELLDEPESLSPRIVLKEAELAMPGPHLVKTVLRPVPIVVFPDEISNPRGFEYSKGSHIFLGCGNEL